MKGATDVPPICSNSFVFRNTYLKQSGNLMRTFWLQPHTRPFDMRFPRHSEEVGAAFWEKLISASLAGSIRAKYRSNYFEILDRSEAEIYRLNAYLLLYISIHIYNLKFDGTCQAKVRSKMHLCAFLCSVFSYFGLVGQFYGPHRAQNQPNCSYSYVKAGYSMPIKVILSNAKVKTMSQKQLEIKVISMPRDTCFKAGFV